MTTEYPDVSSSPATYMATEGNTSTDYNFTVNFTTPRPYTGEGIDYKLLKQIEIGVLSTVFILAVIGNGVVVAFLLLRRKKLSRMNLFIVHLSIADLGVAFFQILSQMLPLILHPQGIVRLPDILCRLHSYTQVVPLFASSYMLVMIAVDRFFAICRPLSNYSWTKKRSYVMILVTWVMSLILSSPQLVFFYRDEKRERCYDIFSGVWRYNPVPYQIYVILMMIFSYIIPTILQTCLYGAIVVAIWSNASLRTAAERSERSDKAKKKNRGRNKGRNDNVVAPRSHSSRSVSKAKVKTVIMTFVVILTFILCWTPYWVSMVIWAFDVRYYGTITAKVIVLLSALNSCTNPFIYLFFNFRLVLKSLPWNRRRDRDRRPFGSESQSMTMSTKMNSSFSFNRGSMSLTALQNANSKESIPGEMEGKPQAELIAMRRYSPNGEIKLDYTGPGETGRNGDINNKECTVRFGGQCVADSQQQVGFRNSGYM